MRKQKILLILISLMYIYPAFVGAQVDPAFDPSKVVDDAVFTDMSAFKGPQDIQNFLEGKGSVLARKDTDFLFMLKEPGFVDLKERLEDPQPNLGRLRTAAELIWDASRSVGLNPQVILVTLQKEQSLITGHQNSTHERLQKALNNSLGFDCPDSTGCGDILPGFYSQLFGNVDGEGSRYLGAARSLMKSFNTPGGRGPSINGRVSKIGDTITISNTQGPPYNAPASSTFVISNSATAALYRYTPHVFNGNYNFWRYMTEWFKLPDGAVVRVSGDSNAYVIQNGARFLLTPFIANLRNISLTTTRELSTYDAENYPNKGALGPADNSVFTSGGRYYLFLNSKKYLAQDFVLKSKGISSASAPEMPADILAMFADAGVLMPNEGFIVKVSETGKYLISKNGRMLHFSDLTAKQYKPETSFVEVKAADIAGLPNGGFVTPVEGTLVTSAQSKFVYLIENGFKKPVTDVIFKNRKFNRKNVITIPGDELGSYTTGAAATPTEKTVIKVAGTSDVYWFLNGQKTKVSSFVQKQRKITPDITVSAQEAGEWPLGLPFPPKDGTYIRGNKTLAVFKMTGGKKRFISAAEAKKVKLKTRQITVLPQAEVDSYISAE